MKICRNCGNRLGDYEPKCSVCGKGSREAIYVEDGNEAKIQNIIDSVRMRNNNIMDKQVNKKPHGCLSAIGGFVVIMLILAIIGSLGSGGDSDTKPTNEAVQDSGVDVEPEEIKPTPTVVSIGAMQTLLDSNALKAASTFENAYVEITGKLTNIDSSGDYISISDPNVQFSFSSVLCDIEEEHLDTVMNFTDGQLVTVVGTITSVGEIMGYTIDVDYFK